MEQNQLLWKSDLSESLESSSQSMMSVTLGRAMTAVLSARPRKLNDAVSRLSPHDLNSVGHISISASLDDSLRFLHKFLNDAAEKNEPLHEILIPMLQNVPNFICLRIFIRSQCNCFLVSHIYIFKLLLLFPNPAVQGHEKRWPSPGAFELAFSRRFSLPNYCNRLG